jgi:hypothetical protein
MCAQSGSCLFRKSTIVVAALLLAHGAIAHDFCVSTSAELQDALTAASDGGAHENEGNHVALREGTYLTGDDAFRFSSNSPFPLSLQGGYIDAACSEAMRVGHADGVVLDGRGITPVLSIYMGKGTVTIDTVTLQHGFTDQTGGGLQVNLQPAIGDVAISNIIVRRNVAMQGGGMYIRGNVVDVVGSLFVHNSAYQSWGAGAVLGGFGRARLVGNTVGSNHSSGKIDAVDGLYVYSGLGSCVIQKNIFWSGIKGRIGLFLDCDAELLDNDYSALHVPFGSPAPVNVNPVSVDPQFMDPAVDGSTEGDFHLAAGSPLIGYSATAAGSGSDLDGKAPPAAGAIDIGAYYETIFADAFDANGAEGQEYFPIPIRR